MLMLLQLNNRGYYKVLKTTCTAASFENFLLLLSNFFKIRCR